MPLASHIQLPERYRVTRHIASGGMASVWEVEDLLLGRVVAVKVLGAQFAADASARARFAREARTAARVCEHPHIATIYDIGEHGEDAFIVMEYFSGGTVADQLRAAADGRRVPRETALRWLREAAGGLDHAHAAGVVHRDVKPANLLLDGSGRLAVGDFGIARLADDSHMTQTGQLLGTAAYLSPEQAIGHQATAASDRYALTVVAYELLTGTRPFAGGPATAQVRQHAEAEPMRASAAAPELPAALDAVFARGLAKQPGQRPATAGSLVAEIERALRPQEPADRTRPLAPVPAPAPRARPRPAAPAPAGADSASAHAAARAPRRVSPLVPIALAAAAVGVVLALALGAGGGGGDLPAASTSQKTTRATAREQPARTTATEQAQAAAEPAQPAAPSGDPAALNAQAYQLMGAGDYAGAIPLLRASVEGYRSAGRTGEVGFAYALFNLGASLNRSGDPAAAVPVLRERMGIANQRGTVRKELDDALAKLGEAPAKDSKHNKDKDKGDGE